MTTRIISTTPLLSCLVFVALSTVLEPAAVIFINAQVIDVDPAFEAETIEAATNSSQTPLLANSESTAHSQLGNEGRTFVPVGPNEFDGRSAYINNQYVDDGETLLDNDSAPPLYQILQEQMEQILGSSVPGEYRLENVDVTSERTSNGDTVHQELNTYGSPALQSNVNSPLFAYDGENYKKEVEDLIGPYKKDAKGNYHQDTAFTKPNPMELPKPMMVGAAKVHSVGMRPMLPTLTTTTAAPKLPTFGYDSHISSLAKQPTPTPSQQSKSHVLTGSYDTQMPSLVPQIIEDYPAPEKYANMRQNSTIHMHKRRITFKTVASASHIISTPLADLMFKYSIGVARPSMTEGGKSENVQDAQPMRNSISTGYNNINMDLLKRVYAGKSAQSSY